jgi:osmotically-inducible protein OsmY
MRIRAVHKGSVAVAILAVATMACNREATPPTTVDTAPPPQQQAWETDEGRLTTMVQARYQADPTLRRSDIDVTTRGNTVVLRGTVENEQARLQAINVARGVEGVDSVDDQLQVETDTTAREGVPADRPDARRTDVRRDDPAADLERSPSWITQRIQAQYFTTPDVRGRNIDVTTTSDGVVTLRGEVEEPRARDEAVRIARETDGVTRVNDQLRVTGQTADVARADPTMPRDTTTTPRDPALPQDPTAPRDTTVDRDARTAADRRGAFDQPDAWVTAKVQAKYFVDQDVKGRDINVDTRDGVVTLTGEVHSEAERRQALALARNTDGVLSVSDQLQVVPDRDATRTDRRGDTTTAGRGIGDTLGDTWVTTLVQSKFFLDADVKARDIDVDTRNGVVTLTGAVASQDERQMAEQIARDTRGVSRVVNQLRVDPTAARR